MRLQSFLYQGGFWTQYTFNIIDTPPPSVLDIFLLSVILGIILLFFNLEEINGE